MSALAVFGICVAITIGLLVIAFMTLGSGFFMLLSILPVAIAEQLTGQRGSFSPNGPSRRAPMFEAVMMALIVLEVLLVAGILFGVYSLIFGWPVATPAAELPPDPLTDLQVYRLKIINTVLWGLAAFFIVMLVFNMIRFREQISKMPVYALVSSYGLPLITYPIAFVFLAASHNYLIHYPDAQFKISSLARFCALMYSAYLIFTSGRLFFTYLPLMRTHATHLDFPFWFGTIAGLFYKILFIYFVVRIFASL